MKVISSSSCFSPAECADLLAYASTAEFAPATMTVGGHSVVNRNLRNSRIHILPSTHPLVSRMHQIMGELNSAHFGIDLNSWYRGELLAYSSDLSESFHWHVDDPLWVNRTPYRKLTGVVQLNSPTDYEGGLLQFAEPNLPITNADCTRGTINVFPSFYQHRVTPITAGTRYSLVTFGLGPMWR